MTSTEEILKSVVEDYKQIENSDEDLLQKCSKIRQSLLIIIKQHLVNSNDIIREIQKAKKQSSETETVLNFFHYLIDGFPHPVFVPSMEQWRSLQQNAENENIRKIYLDFLFFLVSRLIQLTTYKELSVLHEISNNTLDLLIQLIKMQNVKVYQLLLKEIVNLYIELCQLKTKHYLTCSNATTSKLSLKSFCLVLSEHKDITGLIILSFENLENWQITCSKILQMYVPDVNLLVFQKFEPLLLACLDQIIYGQFPLKIASTMLCSRMISSGHPLSEKVLQRLMACVLSLLELMTLDRMKAKYLTTDFSEEIISTCHLSLMQFLVDIFVIIYPKAEVTSVNIPKPELSLDCFHLNMLVSHLSSNIGVTLICDEKIYKFCNYVVLGAFQLVKDNSKTINSSFAVGFLKITQSLICNRTVTVKSSLLTELLTYFYSFLCLIQTQLEPTKLFPGSAVSPDKLTKRLSRKRPHDSSLTKKELEDEKNLLFSQLCIQIHQRFELVLAEFQQILKLFQLKREPLLAVLNGVKTSCADFVMLFEPLLNSLVFLKDNELCKKLLYASFEKSVFTNIFCKFVESVIAFLNQNQTDMQQCEISLLLDVYAGIIKVAKLFTLWYHVYEEMNIPFGQEDKKLLCIALVLFSCVWLENLPWTDFKIGMLSFLSKSTLLSFCRLLNLSCLLEKRPSFNDEQNALILSSCLQGLSLLPPSLSPSWRYSVFLQWALSSCRDDVEVTVLSSVPVFCSKLKSSSTSLLLIDLLNYAKNNEKILSKTQVVKLLIEMLPSLALIMTDNYSMSTGLFSNDTGRTHCLKLKPLLVIKDHGTTAVIDDENLALISVIVRLSCAHLNSCRTTNRNELWESMCLSLGDGLNFVLKYANKRKTASQKLLEQFIQCFHWSLDFKSFEPRFVAKNDEQWNELVVQEIEKSLKETLQSGDTHRTCHLTFLVGALLDYCGKHSLYETELFEKSLQLLCKLFCCSRTEISSTAFVALEKLTAKHKSVLESNRKTISNSLIDGLMEKEEQCSVVQRVFEDAAHVFATSLSEFISANLLYLLPPLVSKQSYQSSGTTNELLELFSTCLDCSKSELIKQNFKHIFCFAVTTGSDVATLFEYLESQTNIKKDSLLLMTHGSLIQHLLARVSVSSERVCHALQIMHQVKSSDEAVLPISELLKPHFLSVLTFFNSQLRLPSVTLADKLQVYKSLIHLLYLLNKDYITTVFVKIVNTLCLAQQVFIDSSKSSLCCKAWHALVRCVDDTCLGTLLSQVVAMLLPCLEKFPNEVSGTIEFMVIEKHEHTKDYFAELYFLPDHRSLDKVRTHIDEELRPNTSSSAHFLHSLEQATKHLSHDSAEVRLCALAQVRKVLQSNQKSLLRDCLITGRVSDLIQSLISALLTCCRDANARIKLLSAKCLGEIGAVDPDKISLIVSSNKPHREYHNSFDEEEFAYDLFNCLVQAFLVAKPSHQDITAFAIQELLKIYKCQEGQKATSAGRKLWRKFSEQIQAVLEPHLSSRYLLKKPEINLATLKRPILHRKQNMTFRDWIGTFCAVLMQMASSSVENSSVVRGVFDACAAVVRSNVEVAFFLLPPTIVEVLKCGDKHLEFITEEIMAVLESTELLQETKKSVSAEDFSSSISRNSEEVSANQTNSCPVHTSHLSQLSAQAVFAVLDHVTLWFQKTSSSHAAGAASRSKLAKEKEQASKFLSMIPQKTLATASLHCRDYPRALLHYETFLREHPDDQLTVESAAFLQRVFIEMNETDGVLGVVNVRGVEPTLETRLLVLESTGALQDAAACYERIISHNPTDVFHYKGFCKCLIDLGQLSEAVNLIEGTITNNPSWKHDLTSYGVEACWRLGKWDMLEKKINSVSSVHPNSWSVGLGEAILAIRKKNWEKLQNILDRLYQSQTDPLSVASMETNSFQRGYDHILRLHALSDLERFSNVIRDQSKNSTIDDVMSLWQLRLQVVQPSFRACDPVLSLGRVLLPLISNITDGRSECDSFVGKLWLRSSKLARKCGLLQTAYGALLSAQRYQLPGYCIEHAKWLWKKGESHQALLTLQRGFAEHYASDSESKGKEQRLERAKVMLLEAKLMEESSSYDPNIVLRKYKEVVAYTGDWEESHFYCGRYYDKLMTSMMGENRATAKAQHLYYVMSHYGRSLYFGTSHIYESLTKLLTLWLDYGETAAKLEKAGRPQSADDVQRLVEVIADVRSRLPAYIFYVAFSQLTSRICHQHQPTYSELKEILITVILAFPQRALWSMIAISKSSFKQRANRCQEIFERVRYKEPKLTKLVTDVITLTNRLLELCNKPVPNIQPLSITTHFKQLKKLVESNSFSEIILPLQKFMNAVLPQSKQTSVLGSQTTHNPFPEATAHIVGFNDTVEILSSLQRPKKISIRASDGKSYAFLCKPKDDLRKDARLAEFAAIVNKCLFRDPESGKRHLRIRTYAVIPLNEECGLIEWVENMKGLRHILLPLYKSKSLFCSGKQLKAWQLPVSAPLQKKLEVFRTKYLPRHPPIFYEWFLTTFPDPSSWYNARLVYARSVAVMSMVGYMLGLGDRHGENILFDSNNGEAMHVDFNCLFNKGLSLEVPEIVPFRLTHNMVNAMGPTKYEGFFRKACEVTMNVLREQREPLMSVLKTFIYDPLVEWSKKSRGNGTSTSGEIISEKALSHVNDIDKRLRGIVGKNKGLPLSIEGHVHYLIQEATDEEKLCQMYIGWAPFM